MKDLIKSLGGAAEIAEKLSVMSGTTLKTNAVYQWPYEGTIPHRWRPYIARLAEEKGVDLPADLSTYAGNAPKETLPPHSKRVSQRSSASSRSLSTASSKIEAAE